MRSMSKSILIVALTALALSMPVTGKPQFITLRDGKIGVNFAGYHAEAGLGGLLTGNAAHGGLSASAGTPFGQKAGAGLGGTVSGEGGLTRGGLYAGATDGFGQGASAALGGRTDPSGAYGGKTAEAHAQGVGTKTVEIGQATAAGHSTSGGTVSTRFDSAERIDDQVNSVLAPKTTVTETRVYPHKKVTRVEQTVKTRTRPVFEKTVSYQPPAVDYRHFLDFGYFGDTAAQYGGAPVRHQPVSYRKEVHLNQRVGGDDSYSSSGSYAGAGSSSYQPAGPGLFDAIFNIPISTLRAVNDLLNGGGVSAHKSVSYSH